jgi:pimeloyl-ACP methyl ester carboxylesterase
MSLYPKLDYTAGKHACVLQPNRVGDKPVKVRPDLPGNIILVHGVNDVGVGYDEVEKGLCAGLNKRLSLNLEPAFYRMPVAADKDEVKDDPDDIFFKRKANDSTYNPVIPFYWGYAEEGQKYKDSNGQKTDRYGNRLDKDLSKGGGPFVNATGTLPDMWNRGAGPPADPVGDPIRPLLEAPGRMYMILAAKRLAALIAMIRDYDKNEVVSLVAHSQGTMLSLLAQAFLMEQGMRPADTLVLMNSPYSLESDTSWKMSLAESFSGGKDVAMHAADYYEVAVRQCLDARLDTLVNIVRGVAEHRNLEPAFTRLDDHASHCGMVGAKWAAEKDRDNRGKVYLYFCPEDMTVALDNLHGIGWQGVPDVTNYGNGYVPRYPVAELTKTASTPPYPGFYQRVFTARLRLDPATKKTGPVRVGMPPHDFAMRIAGEDEHAHVAEANRGYRGESTVSAWPLPNTPKPWYKPAARHLIETREGIRTINGEALPTPVLAQLRAGLVEPRDIPRTSRQAGLPVEEQGPCEAVDPTDAATASSREQGLAQRRAEVIDDPRAKQGRYPGGGAYAQLGSGEIEQLQRALNQGKDADEQCEIVMAFHTDNEKIHLTRMETPKEARLRWQHEFSPASFHSAVFGNRNNHANVTAYDVSIGGGKASSHPIFYAYLCAVADWRLKELQGKEKPRQSILLWERFKAQFADYWSVEPQWRKDLVRGNVVYYSTGVLPKCIVGLRDGLPAQVICKRIDRAAMRHSTSKVTAKGSAENNVPPKRAK